MNTYRREDFEQSGYRLTAAQLFMLGSVMLTLGGIPGFLAGMELQTALHREAKRIEDAKPKRTADVVNPPASLLPNCDTRDFIEFRRTCKGRMRAGAL